jgi:ATP-dependent DNA helicase DinG
MTNTAESQPKTWEQFEDVLAQELPGYEPREPQKVLAQAIELAMGANRNLLAEAGCGTGKSIGGTVPMIMQAVENGERVIVATATKALQEQYANKDMPFLQEKSRVPFTWALVKGRSNYVCMAKLNSDDMEMDPTAVAIQQELAADPEHSGDREHFVTEIADRDWSKLSSSSNECPGKSECPFGAICKAEATKDRGKQVDVVITNQAMLMTDLVIREKTQGRDSGPVEMLGDYSMVLFDEGHELPEYAANALGNDISGRGLSLLVGDVASFAALHGSDMEHRTAEMGGIALALQELLVPISGESVNLRWFTENFEPFVLVLDLFKALRLDIQGVKLVGDSETQGAKKKMLLKRLDNAMSTIEELISSEDHERVRWVETYEVRGNTYWRMKVAPVDVAPFLKRMLWDEVSSVVMSATLSSGRDKQGNRDFSYMKRTLGLWDAESVDVGTPFDFGQQALMFVPGKEVPSPKSRVEWMAYATATTLRLISEAQGGALLLYTSRKAMQEAYDTLSPALESMGLTALMQGDGRTNKELARTFKDDEHSVLFALKSFFVGVDIPGNACRLVIIDKMPFPVPSDPIFKARSLAVERSGGSSFAQLSIPMMTLTLEQGVGRLIRTKSDRGVVAILDSRLSSTPYGRSIVNALPDFPVSTQLPQVAEFFAGASFGR